MIETERCWYVAGIDTDQGSPCLPDRTNATLYAAEYRTEGAPDAAPAVILAAGYTPEVAP